MRNKWETNEKNMSKKWGKNEDRMRNKWGTNEEQMRKKWGKNEEQMKNERDWRGTNEERMRNEWGTDEERMRNDWEMNKEWTVQLKAKVKNQEGGYKVVLKHEILLISTRKLDIYRGGKRFRKIQLTHIFPISDWLIDFIQLLLGWTFVIKLI